MGWERKRPIAAGILGCLNCEYKPEVLPLDFVIGVGFGVATVTKNGRVIYEEQKGQEDWTVADAEREAQKDPDNDWQIHLLTPLNEEKYQRQGYALWVLYEQGIGFA